MNGIANHEAFVGRSAKRPHGLLDHIGVRLSWAVIGAPYGVKEVLQLVQLKQAGNAPTGLAGGHGNQPAFLPKRLERFQRAIIEWLGKTRLAAGTHPCVAIVRNQFLDVICIGIRSQLATSLVQA